MGGSVPVSGQPISILRGCGTVKMRERNPPAEREPDSIRLVRMVRTIGGQRTERQPDSIRLVRMVRAIGGQQDRPHYSFGFHPACGLSI